jgi:hypothetical protein
MTRMVPDMGFSLKISIFPNRYQFSTPKKRPSNKCDWSTCRMAAGEK